MGYCNPVVADGKVFLMGRAGADPNKNWDGQQMAAGPDILTCLDRKDGKVQWKVEFPQHVEFKKSTAWSTAVVEGGFVYARGGDGEVRCLAVADGKMVWTWPKDPAILKSPGEGYTLATSMAICGDMVLFPGVGCLTLVAVDKKTGEVKWETPCGNPRGSPAGMSQKNLAMLEVKGKKFVLVGTQVFDPITGKKWADSPKDGWSTGWCDGVAGEQVICAIGRSINMTKEEKEKATKEIAPYEPQKFQGVVCWDFSLKDDGALTAEKKWEWIKQGGVDFALMARYSLWITERWA